MTETGEGVPLGQRLKSGVEAVARHYSAEQRAQREAERQKKSWEEHVAKAEERNPLYAEKVLRPENPEDVQSLWNDSRAEGSNTLADFVRVRSDLGPGMGIKKEEMRWPKTVEEAAQDLEAQGVFDLKGYLNYLHSKQVEWIDGGEWYLKNNGKVDAGDSEGRDRLKDMEESTTTMDQKLLRHFTADFDDTLTDEDRENLDKYLVSTIHMNHLSGEILSNSIEKRSKELLDELYKLSRELDVLYKKLPTERYAYERSGGRYYEMYSMGQVYSGTEGVSETSRWNTLFYLDKSGLHFEATDHDGKKIDNSENRTGTFAEVRTREEAVEKIHEYIGTKRGFLAEKVDQIPQVGQPEDTGQKHESWLYKYKGKDGTEGYYLYQYDLENGVLRGHVTDVYGKSIRGAQDRRDDTGSVMDVIRINGKKDNISLDEARERISEINQLKYESAEEMDIAVYEDEVLSLSLKAGRAKDEERFGDEISFEEKGEYGAGDGTIETPLPNLQESEVESVVKPLSELTDGELFLELTKVMDGFSEKKRAFNEDEEDPTRQVELSEAIDSYFPLLRERYRRVTGHYDRVPKFSDDEDYKRIKTVLNRQVEAYDKATTVKGRLNFLSTFQLNFDDFMSKVREVQGELKPVMVDSFAYKITGPDSEEKIWISYIDKGNNYHLATVDRDGYLESMLTESHEDLEAAKEDLDQNRRQIKALSEEPSSPASNKYELVNFEIGDVDYKVHVLEPEGKTT